MRNNVIQIATYLFSPEDSSYNLCTTERKQALRLIKAVLWSTIAIFLPLLAAHLFSGI